MTNGSVTITLQVTEKPDKIHVKLISNMSQFVETLDERETDGMQTSSTVLLRHEIRVLRVQ